jgi:hypothetical protein
MPRTNAIGAVFVVLFAAAGGRTAQENTVQLPVKIPLCEKWLLKSSYQMKEKGAAISIVGFIPVDWHPTQVPSTVLNALVKNGVYPDPRIGMNCYRIPDASEEFNRDHDLAKFSYLPEQRNPWRDPYWYRTEFHLPSIPRHGRVWIELKGINYRADVWLNGRPLANREQLVGMYQRFRVDATAHAKQGDNCLAVLVYPVDDPGKPDTQWEVFGPERRFQEKGLLQSVTFTMGLGYDCMPTIPDRAMGLWQDVTVEVTGPVDVRDPFVATDLPLPKTDPASLTVSADLVNASQERQTGLLRGVVEGIGEVLAQKVELAPSETKHVVCRPDDFPKLLIANPRLWWPRQYGPQNLYRLKLSFETDAEVSDTENVTFGIRKVTSKLHNYKGTPGLQVHVNGQKVFAQGGWLQPDILFDMPRRRIEAEVRYLAEANLHTVTFEDLPAPGDAFLEACDRYGLMYWCCFYGSFWIGPGRNTPTDRDLLNRCGADVIRRYRNHPSLVLYSCCGEFVPAEDIYRQWRKDVRQLDGTRLFLPTIDVRQKFEWLKEDVPTGVYDAIAFDWREPATYYRNVREGGKWMFNTEVSIGSVPPVDSLRRFLPDLFAANPRSKSFPLDRAWAHHGANHWYKDYDQAIRRVYGEPKNVVDYCMKAALISADQHRAWSEAVNHRLWEVTSGVWQWKLNSCWPDVNWQIYDWYLRPMPNAYYYRLAFEPIHVQLSPLDGMVTVINRRTRAEKGLSVEVAVYDSESKLRWQKTAPADAPAETYHDVFTVPKLDGLTPVYFAALKLRDAAGQIISRNFYWLSSKEPADFRPLTDLPSVNLKTSYEIERSGEESIVRVRVENPSDRVVFFVHLALSRPQDGEEFLPVFWEDNYFSLAPRETRVVAARLATEALGQQRPTLEAGGYNVQTDYRCAGLKSPKTEWKVQEPVIVTAQIAHTFLDGSRVALLLDGKPVARQWAWARNGRIDELRFEAVVPEPGEHLLAVGDQCIRIKVKP